MYRKGQEEGQMMKVWKIAVVLLIGITMAVLIGAPSPVMAGDLEDLNTLMDETIIGEKLYTGSLADIFYKVIGHEEPENADTVVTGKVTIQVNADVSELLKDNEEDQD